LNDKLSISTKGTTVAAKSFLLLIVVRIGSGDLRQLLWHRHRMVQARTRIMRQAPMTNYLFVSDSIAKCV
jgi:hypothetical protein